MGGKKTVLLIILCLAALTAMINTAYNVQRYGDVDLRNRIVGTRLLKEGKNVYFTKLRDVQDERLMDPCDLDDTRVNRITVSPGLLILMRPLGSLSHGTIQWIWFVLTYSCLIIICLLFSRIYPPETGKMWIPVFASLMICSIGWLLHVERGQIYIFYTCLLSLAYYLYKRNLILFSGSALALLVWLRPTFIIILPLFLLLQDKRKLLGGFARGAVLCLSLSLLFSSPGTWQDYLASMKEWSKSQTGEAPRIKDAVPAHIPEKIEGLENLSLYNKDIPYSSSSLQDIFMLYQVRLNGRILLPAFVLLVSAGVFLFYRRRDSSLQDNRAEKIFLIAFLVYALFEYFTPAPKYTYQYVTWIFPQLLFAMICPPSFRKTSWLLIGAGILLSFGILSMFRFTLNLAEYLQVTGMLIFLYTDKKENTFQKQD